MIIASAIQFYYKSDREHQFPQIWTAFRHADIFENMFKMRVDYDKESAIQGFITDDSIFLDRYQAAEYAIEHKQVIPEQIWSPYECNSKILYSEDLWPE